MSKFKPASERSRLRKVAKRRAYRVRRRAREIEQTSAAETRAECDRYGAGGGIRRSFVTLIKPGEVPSGKGPFLTSVHLWRFVLEAVGGLPATTQIFVHELTWDNQLWTQCAREKLAIDKALEGVDWDALTREGRK